MIRLPLAVFCIAGITLSAQPPQPTPRDRMACLIVGVKPKLLHCRSTKEQQPEMRDFARTAQIGVPWPGGGSPIAFTFEADQIRSEGSDLRLTGNAEINTAAMVLHADEAIYHLDTGEIEAHGSLRVKPQ